MSTIIIRNSPNSGVQPSSLAEGELAINTADGKIYYGSTGGVKQFAGGGTTTIDTGSLLTTASFNAWTGSNSSRFAGTSSYATTASYALNGGGGGITFPYTGSATITGSLVITGSTISTSGFTGSLQGTASWAISSSQAISSSYAFSASYASTSSYAEAASDVLLTVINQTATQINKGIIVRITGSNNSSDTPRVGIADYSNDNLSANTLGIVMDNIPSGGTGSVMTEGLFKGYDTDTPGWATGQVVYLGANGSITGSAPLAPLHSVRLGQVTRKQTVNGAIYIRIDNGYELGELHDVLDTTTTASYGDILIRSGSVWINSKQLTGSYGLTGSFIVTGSATVTGSLNITQGITGSLFGTASWASNFTETDPVFVDKSASLATTGSNTFTGNQTITGSGGLTIRGASTAINILTNDWSAGTNGGMVSLGPYGSSVGNTDSYISARKNGGSQAATLILQYSTGDKVAIGKTSANDRLDVNGNTIITGSLNVTAGITGSLLGTASYALSSDGSTGGGLTTGQVVAISTGYSNLF